MNRAAFAVFLLFLIEAGAAMAQTDLIDDIRAVRDENREAVVVIDDVLRKHLSAGMKKEDAMGVLKRSGFKCYDANRREQHKQESETGRSIACTLDMRKWYSFGFGDEALVSLEFHNENLSHFAGKLIYRSL